MRPSRLVLTLAVAVLAAVAPVTAAFADPPGPINCQDLCTFCSSPQNCLCIDTTQIGYRVYICPYA
jgi:hypothetical protein